MTKEGNEAVTHGPEDTQLAALVAKLGRPKEHPQLEAITELIEAARTTCDRLRGLDEFSGTRYRLQIAYLRFTEPDKFDEEHERRTEWCLARLRSLLTIGDTFDEREAFQQQVMRYAQKVHDDWWKEQPLSRRLKQPPTLDAE